MNQSVPEQPPVQASLLNVTERLLVGQHIWVACELPERRESVGNNSKSVKQYKPFSGCAHRLLSLLPFSV